MAKQPAKKRQPKKARSKTLKNQPKILLVGCGKMGEAMLTGWRNSGINEKKISVIDVNPLTREKYKNRSINFYLSLEGLPKNYKPEIIIFAIKPQTMAGMLAYYKKFNNGTIIFLSIAAGKTLNFLEQCLGNNAPIIRMMPNLNVASQDGVITCIANEAAKKIVLSKVVSIVECLGKVLWVNDEAKIDSATAISGSGPAYIFLFIEILEEIARKNFNDTEAKILATYTIFGSAKTALTSSKATTELKNNVTSKGGTTAAALEVLEGPNGLRDLMEKAVAAAEERAKEL